MCICVFAGVGAGIAVCSVCVHLSSVCFNVCECKCVCVLCWLPHSREWLSKYSYSSELTEEGPAFRQPQINHYYRSFSCTHTHTHTRICRHTVTCKNTQVHNTQTHSMYVQRLHTHTHTYIRFPYKWILPTHIHTHSYMEDKRGCCCYICSVFVGL